MNASARAHSLGDRLDNTVMRALLANLDRGFLVCAHGQGRKKTDDEGGEENFFHPPSIPFPKNPASPKLRTCRFIFEA
jgi:hypothetical protein